VFHIRPDGSSERVAGFGEAGYAGDGGPARTARLDSPAAVASDPAGNLYIADTGNHVVRRVSPEGIIETMAGTGLPGFSGDGGPALTARMDCPFGLAFDTRAGLYVSDRCQHRVRLISRLGVIQTVAGNGLAGFAGDGGPALAGSFDSPSGLAVDASGMVYLADTENQRVRTLTPEADTLPPALLEELPVVNAASQAGGPGQAGIAVSARALPPSRSAVQICGLPPRAETKASCRPSGDQVG
jgi:DNA-binding beta-propeller fold protein YncE